jgi:hypothetical protein
VTSHDRARTTRNGPSMRPARRFSEGMERAPTAASSAGVGRFSDGLARSPVSAPAQRVGGFADGLAERPDARSAGRVGSFSDGLARGRGDRRPLPPVKSRADRGIAA